MPASHDDILDRLDNIQSHLASQDQRSAVFRAETVQRLDQHTGAIRVVAEQAERIEDRILAYDKLKDRFIGGLAAATFMILVVWWLIKDKLESFFGVKAK